MPYAVPGDIPCDQRPVFQALPVRRLFPFWEKDGIYQPILDDAAWSEVKGVVVDIIKSNVEVAGVE